MQSVGASVSGGLASLSEMERAFVAAFISNGGKGAEAALLAGYGEADLHKAASRLLVRPRVVAEIRRQSLINLDAALPIAISALVEIASNQKAAEGVRIKAASELLDRARVQGEHGGGINVQVNVDGRQAQTAMASVWTARAQRLSVIDGTMTDPSPSAPIGLEPAAEGGRGGVEIQGPLGSPVANTSPHTRDLPPPETSLVPSRPTALEMFDDD